MAAKQEQRGGASNPNTMRAMLLLSLFPTGICMSIPTPLDTLTSGLASICRLPYGVTAANVPTRTSIKIKEMYDVENSGDCRRVREAISELDLNVDLVIAAAPNSRCFTETGYEYALPPDTILPRLVLSKEEKDVILSGSDQIMDYFETICGLPSRFNDKQQYSKVLQVLFDAGNVVASSMRVGRGSVVSAAAMDAPRPEKPLVLYSYEGNQFCRLVREVLTELDVVYELRNVGKESPRRQELLEVSGGTQCPYLMDPNNDVSMLESTDIIEYLYNSYARFVPPSELLQWASEKVLTLAKPLFQSTAPVLAGSNSDTYDDRLHNAKKKLERDVHVAPIVVYTYSLSPFSGEAKKLLDSLGVEYTEISLGAEWIPGLIKDSAMRAALTEKTGQSSLPHIFVGGKSIGGLFSGTPGLLPALEDGSFMDLVKKAQNFQTQSVVE